jgi:glycogen debranching enzyme
MTKPSEKRSKSIELEGQKYILASSLLAEERLRVLKHEETFAVFDRFGEIYSLADGEEGIYHQGTRFLSLLDFTLGQEQPLLLSSTITENNLVFSIDFTNADFTDEHGQSIPRGSIHVFRCIFIANDTCYERLRIKNFAHKTVHLPISYRFHADFKDIFELRGHRREKRGTLAEPEWTPTNLTMSYLGLDEVERRTIVSFEGFREHTISPDSKKLIFHLTLAQEVETLFLCYDFLATKTTAKPLEANLKKRFDEALVSRENHYLTAEKSACRIYSSNEQFNNWLNRSYSDLQMMNSTTPYGVYPFAGVPWFNTTFGRDGIITALQTLWVNSEIAKGVLNFLAHTQARDFSAINDAEPGKILHEARSGEMAKLGEIPFGKYYGSADATPLFIVLAGEYFKTTGDRQFIESIWPNIEAALNWLDQHGDCDGDGFIEYSRQSPRGLVNQGWKDSHDSVFHRDGTMAKPPIALCELQGYLYDAKMSASMMCKEFGDEPQAQKLLQEAEILKQRFHEKFWSEQLGTLALALDGEKNKCEVRSSNVGHCLFSGIVKEEVAQRVADSLMSDQSFCGWGIRTIAEDEANYNPMAYHNGSVWPHDTSIIAAGLARYGRRESASRLLTGLFDASIFLDLNRLPELFCGFSKRPSEGPTLYPVSCAPQAWASGAVFMLLKACLGISIEGRKRRVLFDFPVLPLSLDRINIYGLRVGPESLVDVEILRNPHDVGVNVIGRQGEVSVVINK